MLQKALAQHEGLFACTTGPKMYWWLHYCFDIATTCITKICIARNHERWSGKFTGDHWQGCFWDPRSRQRSLSNSTQPAWFILLFQCWREDKKLSTPGHPFAGSGWCPGNTSFRLNEIPNALLAVVHIVLLWPGYGPEVWLLGSSNSFQFSVYVILDKRETDSLSKHRAQGRMRNTDRRNSLMGSAISPCHKEHSKIRRCTAGSQPRYFHTSERSCHATVYDLHRLTLVEHFAPLASFSIHELLW